MSVHLHEAPCRECGHWHQRDTRRRVLARMIPCDAVDVLDSYPCLFSGVNVGREFREMGAVYSRGMWRRN